MSNSSLFEDFQNVSNKQWKQKIQMDLKGADYNDTLIWKSPEGIHVKPFYTQEDIQTHYSPPTTKATSWSISHTIFISDAKRTNHNILALIEKGINKFRLILPSEDISLKTVLLDVPSSVDIRLIPQFLSAQYISSNKTTLLGKSIGYEVDPIGQLVKTGNWFHNTQKDLEELNSLFEILPNDFLQIDARTYHNAGANKVQELAYALAHCNEYLNHFQAKWDNSSKLSFHFSIGGNYFFEIAKLRAFRLLFSSLAAEYGVDANCHITASPSRRNKTLYDYNTNMLRTTTEYMSSILGGANDINTFAYDEIYHKSNEFGDRVARNQLLILKHESYFDFVDNPAEGTYYIESLTADLAQKALDLFKEMESSGGFLKQLMEGTIQKKIKESAHKEQALFEEGKIILVGSNKYANPDDKMKDDLELYPFVKQRNEKTLIEPIIEKRLTETMEQNRLKTE